MTVSRFWLSLALSAMLVSGSFAQSPAQKFGHSKHGSAFDSGMRQKPWRMEGIGSAHFPITTTNPEVQQWYDQGNALLHSFWFEEAERSFRWCHKLEPENAMVYFGLAQCGLNWFSIIEAEDPLLKRYRDFLKESVKRKAGLPERERLYIEAWDVGFSAKKEERIAKIVRLLQGICLKFPEDVEAKTLLSLFNIGQGSGLANDGLINDVLKSNPLHPGAHHVRIHNWDGVSNEHAITSCEQYIKAVPNVGHALHMPGHIYSKLGMWHEAAFAMDSATRIELQYMNARMALPFETWNYSHNRNYLCYIQEQLGMAEASLQGARDLLSAPSDPALKIRATHVQGIKALARMLVKFERWDEILKLGAIPWAEGDADDDFLRHYIETLALLGKGQVEDARSKWVDLKALIKTDGDKSKDAEPDEVKLQSIRIAEGLLRSSEGKLLDAQRLLLTAMENESERRSREMYENDPPDDPWPVARLVGDLFCKRGEHKLAIEAYAQALSHEPNDAVTLVGLATSHKALGETDKAREYYGRLLYVWSNADPNLRWMAEAKALGLESEPIAKTPKVERRYSATALDHIGSSNWSPYAAPQLDCVDSEGKPVRLEGFRGRNVLLVFYLSDQCPHCVKQLVAISSRAADLDKENTVVLAVSSASPASNKSSQSLGDLKLRLLSDSQHENARRFASYDDFEDLELHSTILIDTEGRVRWKRTGGDPFDDVGYLIGEIQRFNKKPE